LIEAGGAGGTPADAYQGSKQHGGFARMALTLAKGFSLFILIIF